MCRRENTGVCRILKCLIRIAQFSICGKRKQLKVAESFVLPEFPDIFRLKKYEFKREGTTFVVKWRMF
jgi:hypothetical protein